MDLIARERAAFQTLYAQAGVRVVPGTSREGIRALFAAECELAVGTRELRPEERAAAMRGRLELEGYRVARDAVIAVVHPDNPLQNLAVEDLRRIYAGEAVRWSDVGGAPRSVRVVIQPPGSDITDFFVQEVMGGRPIGARSIYVANDSEVVARVAEDAEAIGYVSLSAPLVGVRSLRLSALRGLPYWKPDLEAIYRGDYPLTRFINCFVRSAGPRLAHGFITFATSRDGQRIVHEAGLVPTAVPVRFVRRSRMLSTH
jgi:phosphate transport system substrate-binding protein